MLIQYVSDKLNNQTLDTINRANIIIEEYLADGYTLTLRQLYYQFVARGLLDNTERNYKNLGVAVTKARTNGLMSWTAIEDRGRHCSRLSFEEDPASVLDGIEYGLTFDLWERQDYYVEVWIEKEALVGVIERPCERWRTPFMACKGYLSASEAWRAGQRFQRARDAGKETVLIHLGDHDPSGIDMTRDNEDRVSLFSFGNVTVERIALNMDQVEEFNPPPNPAKMSDTRAPDYVEAFGTTSWELDALEPKFLDRLISEKIQSYVDQDIWEETKTEERERRQTLAKLSERWDDVEEFLTGI